jgi:RNA polymerase sigma factor (TIGR02999 family)
MAQEADGDRRALDEMLSAVYTELHGIAARYLSRERAGHTLQPTALVHEAYLRLAGQRNTPANRAQLLGLAAGMMRRILVNHARDRAAQKRGGGATRVAIDRVAIDETVDFLHGADVDVVALDDARGALAAVDPRGMRVVELRFFGGLGVEETAEVLGVSPATVKRDWSVARAWLRRALGGG